MICEKCEHGTDGPDYGCHLGYDLPEEGDCLDLAGGCDKFEPKKGGE